MSLLLLIVLPLLGGLLLLVSRPVGIGEPMREKFGIAVVLATLWVALMCVFTVVYAPMPEGTASIAPRLEYSPAWLQLDLPVAKAMTGSNWQLSLGLDGLGVTLVVLTLVVTLAVMVISLSTVAERRGDYFGWMLLATSGLLLVFTAMDLLLFYIGFEIVLIPLFAMMVGWGRAGSRDAAKRFVLYTLLGSIPMVLALIGISQIYSFGQPWTLHMPTLSSRVEVLSSWRVSYWDQRWVFFLLLLGLGIKTAILPLHTWLPGAYSQSHPTTTAFMAAVVLKMGVFGFFRLMLPFTPTICIEYGPSLLGGLGAGAIVIGALLALAQKDLLLLLAYSSLSHVGFITVGLFSLSREGFGGAALQVFNHGITTAAMFLLVACMLLRRPSLRLDHNSGGMATMYPRLAFFTVFFVAAGVGMPGLNNFVGELLGLSSMMAVRPAITCVACLGILLGAWYSFRMVQAILFGNYEPAGKKRSGEHQDAAPKDLTLGQKLVFGALATMCLVIGVKPNWAIGVFKPDVERLAKYYEKAAAEATEVAAAAAKPELDLKTVLAATSDLPLLPSLTSDLETSE